MNKNLNVCEKPQFVNIPETGFAVEQTHSVEDTKLVKFNEHGVFSFGNFSWFQFFGGFHEFLKFSNGNLHDEAVLLSKLNLFLLEVKFGATQKIDLNYREVKMLKSWLEFRMKHCENERDQRSENFNADTYIGMRYLMLDLKEWLFGEIID